MINARIENVDIEQVNLNKLVIKVRVHLPGGDLKKTAIAEGTLQEMCVLFNSIPFKGKFITTLLKNASCRVYTRDGHYVFHSLS